jgi:aminopeptidase N
MKEASPKTIYLKDYTVPDYVIDRADLNFQLDADKTVVHSHLLIRRNPDSQQTGKELLLMGEGLKLESIKLDGQKLSPADYLLTAETLVIQVVPQDRPFALDIVNTINPAGNTAYEGLYLSKKMLCTQCEAEGFRRITWFIDRPDVMTTFSVRLEADKQLYPVLLSNGNKVDQGELPENRHWVQWHDPFPKSCYLFALVAGDLEKIHDTFVTQSGRTIDLEIYVEAHDIDKCQHAMQSLKKAMRWDEVVYGREYDLDLYMIVAVSHFNMGAMENKGLNIFNTKFVLARPDTATDTDYEHIEGVIAHEYFHNWSGNRVTCRDWFQLSLKEGFTVFRDQEFTADQTSRAVKRIDDVKLLRVRQFAEDAGPLAHPIRPDAYIEINNFYTLTVYEKGAEVVRMLHTLLGAEGFRRGSDLYFQRHDGQAVTCEDFVKAMEDANNVDLTQFRYWYSQAGTPELTVEEVYDPKQRQLTLTISQQTPATPGQPNKKALHIPIKLGLLGAEGQPLMIDCDGLAKSEEVVLELTREQQSFVFRQLPEKPLVSLLRGFSAPVKLHLDRTLEQLAFQLQHDTDSFNRWEAGQQLASRVILDLVKRIQNGQPLQLEPVLLQALDNVLKQSWEDLSYLALLLSLPEENYLAEQMTVVDVDAIHQAREFVRQSLSEYLTDSFIRLYRQYHRDEVGDNSREAIGRRRIKNQCLSYLAMLETDETYQICLKQFAQADNMTDQLAALTAIVNSAHPEREQVLQHFYQQWQDEDLVVDKWFTLQAVSSNSDTFERILSLMEHPAFDLKTPNRVRALVGAFSQSNSVHFHRQDGAGYHFLADQIIALNALNPQVAARLISALTQWRRYDKQRQQLMKAQLQRIMQTENISRDVYEVASKSLGVKSG